MQSSKFQNVVSHLAAYQVTTSPCNLMSHLAAYQVTTSPCSLQSYRQTDSVTPCSLPNYYLTLQSTKLQTQTDSVTPCSLPDYYLTLQSTKLLTQTVSHLVVYQITDKYWGSITPYSLLSQRGTAPTFQSAKLSPRLLTPCSLSDYRQVLSHYAALQVTETYCHTLYN